MRFRFIVLAMIGVLFASAAAAAHNPLYSLTEEDDGIFSNQDRHYTQGFLLARTTVPQAGSWWNQAAKGFTRVAQWLGAGQGVRRHYTWPMIGQSMFTPTDTKLSVPDPHDRPYAGWLYLGASLMQTDARGRTDQFTLTLGDVGSWALAAQTQNAFHKIAGYGKAEGWSHQLHNEPALLAQYRVSWDLPLPRLGPIASDVLPGVGITAGNVLTYGAANLTFRLGQDLAAGGTPRTITPGLSGTGLFDPTRIDGDLGWFVYAGVQERIVWRNIFLQGNSWRSSPSVPMKHYVTDEDLGVALLFKFGLRVDISFILRSHEYRNQDGDDRIGSVTLSGPL